MKNKRIFKTLSALCAALVLMGGFSVTAFAQGPEQPQAEDATNDTNVVEETEDSPALTPEGNAALVDDFGGNKQLITVTTKSGNYFYILIDRVTDPVASRTEQPSDPAVSNTEATPDPADTAPEEPAQPTEQDDNLSAEQEAMKDELSAAEEADNSALDELIGKAVLDHYADAVQPGQIHVESHVVLAEDRRGTETVTVYLLVLQEIYSTDGESLTLENGSYIPTAITFSLSTSSGAVTEYWEPSDGSYSDDIRAKFPPAAAEEALQNDQAYIDDLKTASFQKALEANRSAAS